MTQIDTNRIIKDAARRADEHKAGEAPGKKGPEKPADKPADNIDGVQGFRPPWLKALDEKNVKGTHHISAGQPTAQQLVDKHVEAAKETKVSDLLKNDPSKRV